MSERDGWASKVAEQIHSEFHIGCDGSRCDYIVGEMARLIYDAGCAAQAQKAEQAILAAMEWAAKYPLQGELSHADARAAAEVYALCCEAVASLPSGEKK